MLNEVEEFEILDQFGNKTGKIVNRGIPLQDGEYMGIVTIILINKDGKILVTKRHPNKAPGLMWEVTGGGILAHENSDSAAVRELKEETGIAIEQSELIKLRTIINSMFYFYQYLVILDRDVNLKLGEEEVIDYNFLSIEDFFNFIKSPKFISYIGERITDVKSEIETIYNEHFRR